MFEYYGNTHLQVRFISLIHRDFLISNGIAVPLKLGQVLFGCFQISVDLYIDDNTLKMKSEIV